jgi:hypothetical protein
MKAVNPSRLWRAAAAAGRIAYGILGILDHASWGAGR